MKPASEVLIRPIQAEPYPIATEKKTRPYRVITPRKIIPPPDEEACNRLNAMAKEVPFCIYYKERSYDPL